MSPSGEDAQRLSRLRWQCRRGMLELDLLLNAFIDRSWTDLDAPGRDTFDRLLAVEDKILIDWLLGEAVPAETVLHELVAQIRSASRPI